MKYIIISIKHGTAKEPMFWRPNDAGYTTNPFYAGLYTEEQVKSSPNYYNDGFGTVAVPYTAEALESIGFKMSYDEEKLMAFHAKGLK